MTQALVDKFNRTVDYVRISVTDRCDFRCVYCMAEEMTFLPKKEVLSIEELELVAQAFVELGVKKIRLTGGEPLVRHGILDLVSHVAKLPGLEELNMTSNGSQLVKLAEPLKQAGLHRLNISLDSLDEQRFKAMTRTGDLKQVLAGIQAAKESGFESIKINTVVLKDSNQDEIMDLIEFIRDQKLDISFIEEMPLGQIDSHDREQNFMSSAEIREMIQQRYEIYTSEEKTGGPSAYWRFADGHSSRLGFISPHSHNFCSTCNRVRVTVQGRLLLCLGNEHSVDLKSVLRANPGDIEPVKQVIIDAMDLKPEKHEFNLAEEVQILRFMNTTGG